MSVTSFLSIEHIQIFIERVKTTLVIQGGFTIYIVFELSFEEDVESV